MPKKTKETKLQLDFKIIHHTNIRELEREVIMYLANGYKLHGELILAPSKSFGISDVFFQAVVLDNKE